MIRGGLNFRLFTPSKAVASCRPVCASPSARSRLHDTKFRGTRERPTSASKRRRAFAMVANSVTSIGSPREIPSAREKRCGCATWDHRAVPKKPGRAASTAALYVAGLPYGRWCISVRPGGRVLAKLCPSCRAKSFATPCVRPSGQSLVSVPADNLFRLSLRWS